MRLCFLLASMYALSRKADPLRMFYSRWHTNNLLLIRKNLISRDEARTIAEKKRVFIGSKRDKDTLKQLSGFSSFRDPPPGLCRNWHL
jgi:hypothetical protein